MSTVILHPQLSLEHQLLHRSHTMRQRSHRVVTNSYNGKINLRLTLSCRHR